ncbi:MAG: hypothetical protein NPIRA01_28760 [Nitrospirales bacterium]|nr:MAG: hypothetical protein NPIRA01_28760 [Nitrospirales bacterium]
MQIKCALRDMHIRRGHGLSFSQQGSPKLFNTNPMLKIGLNEWMIT